MPEIYSELGTTLDYSLCVLPTSGEPQYESFLAVLTAIMGAQYPAEKVVTRMTPYELLCYHNGIKLVTEEDLTKITFQPSPIIYYDATETTHYLARIGTDIYDPYAFYQAKYTQGLCQMFAYFLALQDTSQFVVVNQDKKISLETFFKLCFNTQICLAKTLGAIKNDKSVFNKFNKEFLKLDFDYYGIKKGTTGKKFIADFEYYNLRSENVQDYILVLPLVGYSDYLAELSPLWAHRLQNPFFKIGERAYAE